VIKAVWFSIIIQPMLTRFGPHIDYIGYISDRHVSHDIDGLLTWLN